MTAYGYFGVGICERCSRPEHLFVSSNEQNQSLRCIDCHKHYDEVIIDRVPIMDETPNCHACGRPEFSVNPDNERDDKWQFVTAYLIDRETEVTAHRDCTTLSRYAETCEGADCNYIYVTARNVHWSQWSERNYVTMLRIDGSVYCDHCARDNYERFGGRQNFGDCPSCDEIFYLRHGAWYRGGRYCQSCYDNYYYTCDDCGEDCWENDGHECEEEEDESVIHNYSYRPSPYFFGKGQYYLGFELEVESRNSSRYEGAELVQNELGAHAYMKDDGSLNDGFEVVTHPHTLEAYQREFNWEFIPKLKSEGFRSWNTDTCGLHVHVSRTAFGTGREFWKTETAHEREQIILKRQAHELRFMKLIYDNQRQVERIAGRANNQYATFRDKGKLVPKVKFGNQSNGRYSAINTDNDATLEVRVFKGSLRKERILSALEFVTASVEYTRDLKVTATNQALSWLRFTAYVSENMETYPNLALIMSESFASDTNPNEN